MLFKNNLKYSLEAEIETVIFPTNYINLFVRLNKCFKFIFRVPNNRKFHNKPAFSRARAPFIKFFINYRGTYFNIEPTEEIENDPVKRALENTSGESNIKK